jgi:hypothetical protein
MGCCLVYWAENTHTVVTVWPFEHWSDLWVNGPWWLAQFSWEQSCSLEAKRSSITLLLCSPWRDNRAHAGRGYSGGNQTARWGKWLWGRVVLVLSEKRSRPWWLGPRQEGGSDNRGSSMLARVREGEGKLVESKYSVWVVVAHMQGNLEMAKWAWRSTTAGVGGGSLLQMRKTRDSQWLWVGRVSMFGVRLRVVAGALI